MKTTLKITLAAVACAGIATAALAHNGQGHGPRAERMVERMDTDKDGRVTKADAVAFAAARFARMDADGNGEVTREERRAARKAMRQERRADRFSRMDADADGSITEAEMRAFASDRAARRFVRLDRNGDGAVALSEIEDRRAGRHHRDGHKHARGSRGPLTADKVEARVMKRFDRIDADGDGVVTLQEARAMQRGN